MTVFKSSNVSVEIKNGKVDIGDVGVKFYTQDINTTLLNIRVLKDEQFLNFNDEQYKPFINLFMGDGSVFLDQPVEISDAENGLLTYKLADKVKHAGWVKFKLILKKEDESLHAANFKLEILDSGLESEIGRVIDVDILMDAFERFALKYPEKIRGKAFTYEDFTEEQLALLKGPKGDKGDKGEPGADGKSAYEVALANGFKGSEAEWVASLKDEFTPKESVKTKVELPSDAKKNEIRLVVDENKQYIFDGSKWIEFGAVKLDGLANFKEVVNNRLDGYAIDALYPPVPLNAMVADANYYNPESFKYFKDKEMTIPATDNQPMLQAMVDYLSSKGGGTIKVPNGSYAFRDATNWKSEVSLKGAGKTSTKFFAEGVQFSFIKGLYGSSNGGDYLKEEVWLNNCSFTDFLVDNKGLSFSSPTVSGKAFFILYMRQPLFRDLILLNTLGTALGCDFLDGGVMENIFTDRAGRSSYPTGYGGNSGIGIGSSALPEEPVVVTNCFAYNSGNYGFFVETQINPQNFKAKYAKFVNCHAQGNKVGFGNKGSGATQFINCTSFNNRVYGFHLTQKSEGDQIINCVSENNGDDGIRVEADYLGNLDVLNTVIKGNGKHGVSMMKSTAGLKNVKINNNKIYENGLSGVYTAGNVDNLMIQGNEVFNNGKATSTSASYRRGIKLDCMGSNPATRVNISGNTVFDSQSVQTQVCAIELGTNVNDYILANNNVTTYSAALSYDLKSENGVIGKNLGMIREASGIANFAEGVKAIYVNHMLGKTLKKVNLTAIGSERVWLTENRENNRIRIEREGTTGALDVMWEAYI